MKWMRTAFFWVIIQISDTSLPIFQEW